MRHSALKAERHRHRDILYLFLLGNARGVAESAGQEYCGDYRRCADRHCKLPEILANRLQIPARNECVGKICREHDGDTQKRGERSINGGESRFQNPCGNGKSAEHYYRRGKRCEHTARRRNSELFKLLFAEHPLREHDQYGGQNYPKQYRKPCAYPGQGRAVLAVTEVDRTESAQLQAHHIRSACPGNAEQRERAECHYPASAPLDGETEIVMLHIHVAGVIHAGDCRPAAQKYRRKGVPSSREKRQGENEHYRIEYALRNAARERRRQRAYRKAREHHRQKSGILIEYYRENFCGGAAGRAAYYRADYSGYYYRRAEERQRRNTAVFKERRAAEIEAEPHI